MFDWQLELWSIGCVPITHGCCCCGNHTLLHALLMRRIPAYFLMTSCRRGSFFTDLDLDVSTKAAFPLCNSCVTRVMIRWWPIRCRYESAPDAAQHRQSSRREQSHLSVFNSLLSWESLNVNKPRLHLNIGVYTVLPVMYTSVTEAAQTAHSVQHINTVYHRHEAASEITKWTLTKSITHNSQFRNEHKEELKANVFTLYN